SQHVSMVRLLVRVLGPEERGAGRPRRGYARGGPPPPARRGAEVRLRAVEPHRRGGSARRSGLRRPDLRDAAPAPRERLRRGLTGGEHQGPTPFPLRGDAPGAGTAGALAGGPEPLPRSDRAVSGTVRAAPWGWRISANPKGRGCLRGRTCRINRGWRRR